MADEGLTQDISLGRAIIDIECPDTETRTIAPPPLAAKASVEPSGIQKTLRTWKQNISASTKDVLGTGSTQDDRETAMPPVLAGNTVASSTSRLQHSKVVSRKITARDIFQHPIDTIKQKTLGAAHQELVANIAVSEVSHGQNVDLIKSQDRVENAIDEDEKRTAIHERDVLVANRQATYVRWTMDRHVTKCRVLPSTMPPKPSLAEFSTKSNNGKTSVDYKAYLGRNIKSHIRTYGQQYIGYNSDPGPLSKKSCVVVMERVIIASSPLQRAIMTMRKIGQWQDPQLTSICLTVFLLLWYWDLIVPGVLSTVIYLVMRRRNHGETIEDLREYIKQVEDRELTALTISDLMAKEGADLWADDLIQNLGRGLMIWISDWSDLFEIARNFYEWRAPSRTWITLGILGTAIPITIIVPVWILAKSSLLLMALVFFVFYPLATKYPDHRLLLSMSRRLMWNIPTHGQWALQSLQAEGLRLHEKLRADPDSADDADYNSFPASYEGRRGRLINNAAGVRFEANIGHSVLWTLKYEEMNTLVKSDQQSTQLSISSSRKSESTEPSSGLADKTFVLKDMDDRDLAFTQILGLSDQTWQIVW